LGTSDRERRSMGYSESISTHTAITSTENSRHGVQNMCMGNDEGCAGRGMVGAINDNVQSRCMRNEDGRGTCTVHRAKHARGDCVWITGGIVE